MRPVTMLIVILAFTACALGQQAAPPATPANGAQPAAPAGKKSPKAKSQEELNAYTAAGSITDPAAMEKAADDFAAKFPDSDLTPLLYRTVMRTYQAGNNSDKLLEMSEKVLKSDPDDPEALVDVAQVLTERTRDSDVDKDQALARAMQCAQHALETVDHDVPPGLTGAQGGYFQSPDPLERLCGDRHVAIQRGKVCRGGSLIPQVDRCLPRPARPRGHAAARHGAR